MIIAYTGKTGSGKTYLMIKEAFKEWLNGRNIYSNTILDFDGHITGKRKRGKLDKIKFWKERQVGKIHYFENITEILDIRDGLILFDEAQVLFNARQWESLPEEFQYKLQQHRKHQIDLYCTTQNMGTIDITYRRLVHAWFHCRNIIQVGSSPRILLGLFKREIKDIDHLYNTVDDLVVPTLKTNFFTINFFSQSLYDTMYDIGFRKFQTIWLSNQKSKYYLIIPKKMTIKQALMEIKMMKSLEKTL